MTLNQAQFAWLEGKRENYFTQFGEWGILNAIFERIGKSNEWCLEVGASDGLFFSNTRGFIEQGWWALLIEADEQLFARLGARYSGDSKAYCFNYRVVPNGVYTLDKLLEKVSAPKDIDLVVIDIDGGDYHIFNSLLRHRPRVIVCEYDPSAPQDFIPEVNGEGQAGLNAICALGIGRYYFPVAITSTNVIFVQQELCPLLADDVIVPEPKPRDEQDCVICGYPPSANMPCLPGLREMTEAKKASETSAPKIAAVMSTPRVGPLATMDAVFAALAPFNIPLLRGEGAFWHHSLTRAIEKAIEAGAEYILTVDYDTVFEAMPTNNAVAKLVCLLIDHPDVDVIVSAQMKREGGPLLATTDREVRLLDPMIPITQGHFGLTMFRASVFERLPKPWLRDVPNEKGEWNENRVDADIAFWKLCEAHGINVQMSLDVMIGHMEWVVTWPGQGLRPVYQPLNDWREKGKPLEAFDRQRVIAAVKSNPALLYGAKMEMGG